MRGGGVDLPVPRFSWDASSSSAALFLLLRSCADILDRRYTPARQSSEFGARRGARERFQKVGVAGFFQRYFDPDPVPLFVTAHSAHRTRKMAPSIPPYLPVAESYTPTHPELFRIIFAKGDFASSLITVAVSPHPNPCPPRVELRESRSSPRLQFHLSLHRFSPLHDTH